MGLIEAIEEAVKPAMEKVRSEITDKFLDSSEKECKDKVDVLIQEVYKTRDLKLIEELGRKIEEFEQYVKTGSNSGDLAKLLNRDRKPYSAFDKKRLNKKRVVEVIEQYAPKQLIPEEELLEKTGLSLRIVRSYTRGRNPLLVKEEEGYYRGRTLEEEPHREQMKRLKHDRETLIAALNGYSPESTIPKYELAEKTGLNVMQLSCYTRGKNPLLIAIGNGNYKKSKGTLKKK